MRRATAAIVIAVGLLCAPEVHAPAAHADESLPPPTVIKRRGGTPAATPRAVPTPTPRTVPAPTPRTVPAPPGTGSTAWPGGTRPPPPPAPPSQPGVASPWTTPAPGTGLPPTQRDIQRSVDAYLEGDAPLFAPTSMPGSVGYEQGFLMRTGGFRLRINAVLQARYEAFLYDPKSATGESDFSGFSLPRAVIRLSGTSEPNFRYFMELDFGSNGGKQAWRTFRGCLGCKNPNLGPDSHNENFDKLKEAWIEWRPATQFNVRAGLIRTPASRQLMVQPELTQFVDIGLGTAWTGLGMPGYTDRNRDYGVMFHGAFAARDAFQYMLAVTNGDGGDHVRNVIDQRSSDNVAVSARVNWAFLNPIGYQEGALRQTTNRWYGELGAWGFYYGDRLDNPHNTVGDYTRYGIDLALGYGGWSLTGGVSFADDADVLGTLNDDSTAWVAQIGHHFVGTPFEIAARWTGFDTQGDLSGDGVAQEFGLALNYYLNGHGSKLQADVAYIDTDSGGFLILESYGGYPGDTISGDNAWLLRFQWQLAL